MSPHALTFRFSGERSEYHLSDKKPNVGDVFERSGENWAVASVEEDKDGTTVVILRPEREPA